VRGSKESTNLQQKLFNSFQLVNIDVLEISVVEGWRISDSVQESTMMCRIIAEGINI